MSGRHFAPAHQQPHNFAWTPEGAEAARAALAKYPEARKASAVIPLLDLAQRQEGWVSLAAIEHIAGMLEMAPIRVQEVASFYFMFNLAPVGKYHVQVCGTTPCWLRGVDNVYAALKEECGIGNGETSADGLFTVTEVECLGACVNAPMVQINDDYYEDLDKENFAAVLRALKNGQDPKANSQNGRHSSEPQGGATTLNDVDFDAIIALGRARKIGEAEEEEQEQEQEAEAPEAPPAATQPAPAPSPPATPAPPASTPPAPAAPTQPAAPVPAQPAAPAPTGDGAPADSTPAVDVGGSDAAADQGPPSLEDPNRPPELLAPRNGQADDLKRISGVGPKIEEILNSLGIYHFDQVAAWTPPQVEWVNGYLKFKGRIDREGWIEQAKSLASEGGS